MRKKVFHKERLKFFQEYVLIRLPRWILIFVGGMLLASFFIFLPTYTLNHNLDLIRYITFFWTLVNLPCAYIMFILWRTERKRIFFLFLLAFSFKSLWGFITTFFPFAGVDTLNLTLMRVIAALLGFFLSYTLLNYISKQEVDGNVEKPTEEK